MIEWGGAMSSGDDCTSPPPLKRMATQPQPIADGAASGSVVEFLLAAAEDAEVSPAAEEALRAMAGASSDKVGALAAARQALQSLALSRLPPLHRAAHEGDTATLVSLLAAGHNVNQLARAVASAASWWRESQATLHDGWSALMLAAEAGHLESVRALLAAPVRSLRRKLWPCGGRHASGYVGLTYAHPVCCRQLHHRPANRF